MSNYGFVYVLRNDCMPGIFKIGYTDRSPLRRCEELSASTGIPCPFELVCYGEVEDPQRVESDLHFSYSDLRLNKGREFFRLSFERLADIASEIKDRSANFISCSWLSEEAHNHSLVRQNLAATWFFMQSADFDAAFEIHAWVPKYGRSRGIDW